MTEIASSNAPGAEQRFSSRLALFLSVLSIAVGTGNIWRFPRIVAQNGGESGAAAFLIAEFTGGDAGIRRSLTNAVRADTASMYEAWGVSPELGAYYGRVMAAHAA